MNRSDDSIHSLINISTFITSPPLVQLKLYCKIQIPSFLEYKIKRTHKFLPRLPRLNVRNSKPYFLTININPERLTSIFIEETR